MDIGESPSVNRAGLPFLRSLYAALEARGRGSALVVSQVCAVAWWLVALHFWMQGRIPAWIDQQTTFLPLAQHFFNPYAIPSFVSPAWVALTLLPMGLLPLPLATLVQSCFYFALMTFVIFKYKGTFVTALIVFTSFVALDAVIECNIEWLVSIGLLVPPMLSGPFLLSKPQIALGVMLSYKRRDLLRALLVILLVFLVSLLIWGVWPLQMWQAVQSHSLGRDFNVAPVVLLPWPIAVGIGIVLAYFAFKRRDPALSILAWIFFVPYITLYSLLIPFCMIVIRYPRLGLLITVVMWILIIRVVIAAF